MRRRARGGGLLLLLLTGLCLTRAAEAADRPREREFHVVPAGSALLTLSHNHIDAATVTVSVDGCPWTRGDDFRVRARSGVIVPLRPWRRATAGPGGDRAVVVVSYRFLPVPVTPRIDLRRVVTGPALSSDLQGPSVAAPTSPVLAPRANNLQVSGSKTVQVASGSRRELTVDQNLRLNIAGQLTEDITVRAFLSDDNLPVVPEGNTEELRDIDKVLIELRSRSWSATLGDFVAERRGTRFGDYRRKLQGVTAEVTPGRGRVEALAGSPRGLYGTLQIRGQEANQGPYYLAGSSGVGNIFVVAGSERVTLDGQVLTRGADRDYVIDYVAGTVSFTYRRLITAESTIVIEYEEGEGPYGRTVVGGGAGTGFTLPVFDIEGDFGVRVIREKDDSNRLRTGELDDGDQAILGAAGDNPLQAVASGASQVATGEGAYDQALEDGKVVYVHNPDGGDWNLNLYWTGSGKGDYTLDRITETGERVFKHVGDGVGDYRIGRPLAMPESRSVMTMTASLGDTAGVHLGAEWDVSNHDLNLLSTLDDDDNPGQATLVTATVAKRPFLLGGQVDGDGFYTARQASFRGFQLSRNVFDYDAWGLADRARREGFLEEGERESGLRGRWQTGSGGGRIALVGRGGKLVHGTSVTATQTAGEGRWELAGGRGEHLWQRARAEDSVDPLDIERHFQRHRVAWRVGPVVPEARYQQREWQDDALTGDRAAGARYEEWSTALAAASGRAFDWRAEFKRGRADSLRAGAWRNERDSRTTTGRVSTGRVAGMRLVCEGTLRRIRRPDMAEESTRLARVNLAGVWDRSASDWSLGYRVDNSRSEVRDRQIVFVGEGQGDYNRDGQYVGPEQGDHDLILAGTDSLLATTAVEVDLHWRQGFKFLGADQWYGAWSSLTVAQVEGRSTTEEVGKLLALNPAVLFDRENAVLADVTFREELTLLQHLRTVDLRGIYDFRQSRDRQFSSDPEDRYTRNLQVTGNITVSRVSSVRLRWVREDERRFTMESAASSRRSYESLVRRYEAAWNLRLAADLRLSLQAERIERRDEVSGVVQSESALRPSGRHRFLGDLTVQADVRWGEVTSDEPAGSVRPWFYPVTGRNVESNLRLAWEPTEYLTVSASWFTRKQGERRWQHDVRLETTARF